MPLFALLIAFALTTPLRAAAVFAVALALSDRRLRRARPPRRRRVPHRGRRRAVEPRPGARTLRAHHLGYAYASYWIAWRISFESQLRIVGAKSSYAHPFARAGRVYPGDPPNDLGIDPTYYREAERPPRRRARVRARRRRRAPRRAAPPPHGLHACRQRRLRDLAPARSLRASRTKSATSTRSRAMIHHESTSPQCV